MELLESQWFFQMVDSQGRTPDEKLVAVFRVVGTWISAPGMREMFMKGDSGNYYTLHANTSLKIFLTNMAVAAKARNPGILANQLIILLQGAIAEELRNPGMRTMEGATQAAQAVVSSCCNKHGHSKFAWQSAGALAATVLVAVLGWHITMQPAQSGSPASVSVANSPLKPRIMPAGASPDTIDAVLVLQGQIERGICPAPQLLALPPGQMTAYMNVVNFRTPENPAADRENIRAFLAWFDKVRASECYMPPSNGHTTVAWVKRKS